MLSKRRPDLLPLLDVIGKSTLTKDQHRCLRGVVNDEFCTEGLREDDEPNAYGLELEDVIDWLGHQ